MIPLTDIAYVRSGVEDLEGAVRFASEVVGLEVVASDEPGVAHLRADARGHCLTFVQGRSGVISAGFTVAGPEALAEAETELRGGACGWNAGTGPGRVPAVCRSTSPSTTRSATGSNWPRRSTGARTRCG
ncbi:hypothetical protein O1M54_02075 [Streptomyces diastatochromogenes]|nr:hypothetical protein [Streptomyces diastatochromogenes]